jgi:hypothetical protein
MANPYNDSLLALRSSSIRVSFDIGIKPAGKLQGFAAAYNTAKSFEFLKRYQIEWSLPTRECDGYSFNLVVFKGIQQKTFLEETSRSCQITGIKPNFTTMIFKDVNKTALIIDSALIDKISHPVTSLDATDVEIVRESESVDELPDIGGLFAVPFFRYALADKRKRAVEFIHYECLAQTVCLEPGISDVDTLLQGPIALYLPGLAFFFCRSVKVLYFHANIITHICFTFNNNFNFFGDSALFFEAAK